MYLLVYYYRLIMWKYTFNVVKKSGLIKINPWLFNNSILNKEASLKSALLSSPRKLASNNFVFITSKTQHATSFQGVSLINLKQPVPRADYIGLEEGESYLGKMTIKFTSEKLLNPVNEAVEELFWIFEKFQGKLFFTDNQIKYFAEYLCLQK